MTTGHILSAIHRRAYVGYSQPTKYQILSFTLSFNSSFYLFYFIFHHIRTFHRLLFSFGLYKINNSFDGERQKKKVEKIFNQKEEKKRQKFPFGKANNNRKNRKILSIALRTMNVLILTGHNFDSNPFPFGIAEHRLLFSSKVILFNSIRGGTELISHVMSIRLSPTGCAVSNRPSDWMKKNHMTERRTRENISFRTKINIYITWPSVRSIADSFCSSSSPPSPLLHSSVGCSRFVHNSTFFRFHSSAYFRIISFIIPMA